MELLKPLRSKLIDRLTAIRRESRGGDHDVFHTVLTELLERLIRVRRQPRFTPEA
jgi:hypothetical protein